eukprot:TRINITY_DN10185_c0_g1_i3.p1 TRINITY_DN10185_c0_g1~~TRINITY_DN10185_c0_g1_i3.p1  ORF type:complete len:557 (+),score=137.07 TRINITY_DN10185_c0_g1_i3:145-1671(+)
MGAPFSDFSRLICSFRPLDDVATLRRGGGSVDFIFLLSKCIAIARMNRNEDLASHIACCLSRFIFEINTTPSIRISKLRRMRKKINMEEILRKSIRMTLFPRLLESGHRVLLDIGEREDSFAGQRAAVVNCSLIDVMFPELNLPCDNNFLNECTLRKMESDKWNVSEFSCYLGQDKYIVFGKNKFGNDDENIITKNMSSLGSSLNVVRLFNAKNVKVTTEDEKESNANYFFVEKLQDLEGVDLNAVLQMALSLGYLHRKGVVHRDVKLDNFVRAIDLEKEYAPDVFLVKIIDFGLSVQEIGPRGSKPIDAVAEYELPGPADEKRRHPEILNKDILIDQGKATEQDHKEALMLRTAKELDIFSFGELVLSQMKQGPRELEELAVHFGKYVEVPQDVAKLALDCKNTTVCYNCLPKSISAISRKTQRCTHGADDIPPLFSGEEDTAVIPRILKIMQKADSSHIPKGLKYLCFPAWLDKTNFRRILEKCPPVCMCCVGTSAASNPGTPMVF